MAAINNWMAEARRLESSGDVQGAIGIYRNALVRQEETAGFADLGLHNGLGDLYLRAGMAPEALEAYQRAAEQCEQQQLYANSIALCKKILRNAPGHLPTFRRVARLSALSGLEAEAQVHYTAYRDGLAKDGREAEALECLKEMLEASADQESTVALVDALVGPGDPEAVIEMLRDVKRRREAEGRGVVLVVRRIQELQHGVVNRTDEGAQKIDARVEPTTKPETPSPTPGPTPEGVSDTPFECGAPTGTLVAQLLDELHETLADTHGALRFHRALELVEAMLELRPGHVELLARKLHYAYVAGDEASAVSAYLELGKSLDRDLKAFTLRALSSVADDGRVIAAVSVEELSGLAPGS